jgi:hypothetical protein
MSTPTEISNYSNSSTSKGSERSNNNCNTKGRKGYRNNSKCSHSNSNNRNSNNNHGITQKQKGATKDLGHHVFDCTSRKSIEACNETLKQIAIYVGKEYGKNADAIKYVVENLEDPDLNPVEDISVTDQKNSLMMFHWQEKVKQYMDREEGLESGKKKLYTLIWGQCTKLMKNELEATSNYQSMNMKQDPIALIKAIKGITYSFRDQKYLPGSLWHAYKNLFNTVQHEDEDLNDFYKRFQNAVKVLENFGGNIKNMTNLYKIEETYNKLDTDEKSEIININMANEKTKEMFLGYGILANCDKKKYGRLVEDLENEYTFGDNKYPKMQQKAYEYAMNYKKYKPKVNNNNSGNRVRDGLAFTMTGKGG